MGLNVVVLLGTQEALRGHCPLIRVSPPGHCKAAQSKILPKGHLAMALAAGPTEQPSGVSRVLSTQPCSQGHVGECWLASARMGGDLYPAPWEASPAAFCGFGQASWLADGSHSLRTEEETGPAGA